MGRTFCTLVACLVLAGCVAGGRLTNDAAVIEDADEPTTSCPEETEDGPATDAPQDISTDFSERPRDCTTIADFCDAVVIKTIQCLNPDGTQRHDNCNRNCVMCELFPGWPEQGIAHISCDPDWPLHTRCVTRCNYCGPS